MATQTSVLRDSPGDVPIASAVLVDVVVLSHETALWESIRGAVGERNPTWRARSTEEAVDMLLLGRCGVLVVDMATVATRPVSLIEQIHAQFPDVVIVVAGRRDDEAVLASLVSNGLVYRFMHKPLSARRAGMFLQAAVRQYSDRRSRRAVEPLLPMSGPLAERSTGRYWGLAAALIGAVVIGVAVFTREESTPTSMLLPVPPAVAPAPADANRADPVLSRARAALEAGRYEAPAGRNALDLFHAVLLSKPDNAEARSGLARAGDAVLTQAGQAWDSGEPAEAMRLVRRVLAVMPEHTKAKSLLERMQTTPAPEVGHDTANITVDPVVAASVESTPEPVTPPAVAGQTPADADPARASTIPRAVPAQKSAATPQPSATPRAVRPLPDPLQPTLAMSTPARRAVKRNRTFGAPIATGQAIAGVDTSPIVVEREAEQPNPQESGTSAASDAIASVAPMGVADGTEFVESRELEQLASIEPAYPIQAMRQGTEGSVTLEFTVTETGEVRDVLVTQSTPSGVFDDAAVDAVSQWRYRARVTQGRPVPIRTAATLRFDLDR